MGISLNGLGTLAHSQGDYASARTYHTESLTLFREIGDPRGMVYSLEAFAGLSTKQRKWEQAAVLWGAAEALREVIGSPRPADERDQYDRDVAEVHQELEEEAFSTAWAKGRSMTMKQAVTLALEFPVV